MRRMPSIVFLFAATLAMSAVELCAQSRKGLSNTGVTVNTPGGRTSSATFANYSYGLGNLQRPPAGGSGVLQIPMYGFGGSSSPRGGRGASAGGSALRGLPEMAPRTGVSYTPVSSLVGKGPDAPVAKPRDAGELPRLFLESIDMGSGSQLSKEAAEPITTLVPTGDSDYRKYMEEGEKLFRDGRFAQSVGQFQTANYLANDDAASLLSMAHAMCAIGNYNSASFYLQEAMKYLPELPVIPLKVRALFGNDDRYRRAMDKLKDRLKSDPADASSQLLLAYFLWYDEKPQEAVAALDEAAAAVKDPKRQARVVEAIDIFRRGMEASGVASSQPAATQPAEQAPPAKAGADAAASK